MLIYFYAPSLKIYYELIEKTRDLYAQTLIELIDSIVQDKRYIFEILRKINLLLDSLFEKISQGSADIARSYFK